MTTGKWTRPLTAGTAAVLALSAAAPASISLVSQERGVGANAYIGGEDGPTPLTKTAPGYGLFDQTTAASVLDEIDQDRAEASSHQRSTVSTSALAANGRLTVAENSELANARALYRVVFDVVGSQAYSLKYHVTFDPMDTSYTGDIGTVGLRRLSPDPVAVAGPDTLGYNPVDVSHLTADFAGTGTLPAGRYELALDVDGGGLTAQTRSQVDYDLSLKFVGGSGGPPSAVPLPPAAWTGLATLGLLAGGQAFRRRRQRLAAAL